MFAADEDQKASSPHIEMAELTDSDLDRISGGRTFYYGGDPQRDNNIRETDYRARNPFG